MIIYSFVGGDDDASMCRLARIHHLATIAGVMVRHEGIVDHDRTCTSVDKHVLEDHF